MGAKNMLNHICSNGLQWFIPVIDTFRLVCRLEHRPTGYIPKGIRLAFASPRACQPRRGASSSVTVTSWMYQGWWYVSGAMSTTNVAEDESIPAPFL